MKSFEALGLLLRDLMENKKIFGGKTIVLGGDFRQTLPIVLGGSRVVFCVNVQKIIIKDQICDGNMYAHSLSSIMSCCPGTASSCPANVVKTRMMNQAAWEEDKTNVETPMIALSN